MFIVNVCLYNLGYEPNTNFVRMERRNNNIPLYPFIISNKLIFPQKGTYHVYLNDHSIIIAQLNWKNV